MYAYLYTNVAKHAHTASHQERDTKLQSDICAIMGKMNSHIKVKLFSPDNKARLCLATSSSLLT